MNSAGREDEDNGNKDASFLPTLEEEGDGDISSRTDADFLFPPSASSSSTTKKGTTTTTTTKKNTSRRISFSDDKKKDDSDDNNNNADNKNNAEKIKDYRIPTAIPKTIPRTLLEDEPLPPHSPVRMMKSYVQPLSSGSSSKTNRRLSSSSTTNSSGKSSGGGVSVSDSVSDSDAESSFDSRTTTSCGGIGGICDDSNNNNNTSNKKKKQQQSFFTSNNTSSGIVGTPLTFSEVLQNRSDSIRASLAYGGSSGNGSSSSGSNNRRSTTRTSSRYGSSGHSNDSSSNSYSSGSGGSRSRSRRHGSPSLISSRGSIGMASSGSAGSAGSTGSRYSYSRYGQHTINQSRYQSKQQQQQNYKSSTSQYNKSHNLYNTITAQQRTTATTTTVRGRGGVTTRGPIYREYKIDDYALVISEGSTCVPTDLTVQPTIGTQGTTTRRTTTSTGGSSLSSRMTITNQTGVHATTMNSSNNFEDTATRQSDNKNPIMSTIMNKSIVSVTGGGGRGSLLLPGGGGGGVTAACDGDGNGNDNETNNNNNNNNSNYLLVNKHGYLKGEGIIPEETIGPYLYVLTKIVMIRYEEHEVFWTVRRQDNGEEMRGDACYMEPIPTENGLIAALRAARRNKKGSGGGGGEFGGDYCDVDELLLLDSIDRDGTDVHKHATRFNMIRTIIVNFFCILCCCPIFCLWEVWLMVKETDTYFAILHHGKLFLNGIEPYKISFRITSVNYIVLCSIWYLFIDQIRLAFIPYTADTGLAWVNFIVWLIMVLELISEFFIRPDGWYGLVRSDHAFTPKTARYINAIHLFVESISLGFFIPVFICIFNDDLSCSDRVTTFSFLWSTIASVVGPHLSQALIGRAFYGVIRFRVFALIRHWRNAWIDFTFLNERKYKKLKEKKRMMKRHYKFIMNDDRSVDTADTMDDDDDNDRSKRELAYGGGGGVDRDDDRRRHSRNSSYLDDQKFKATSTIAIIQGKECEEAKLKASNIGTALMTVNSHRALFMICFLAATFPMIFLIDDQRVMNPQGSQMVEYLQEINQQVPFDIEDNHTDCEYLYSSVDSWVKSLAPLYVPNRQDASKFLLTVSIRPPRCYEKFNETKNGNFTFYVGDGCPSWSWPDEEFTGGCIYANALNISQEAMTMEEVAPILSLRLGSIETYRTYLNVTNTDTNATTTTAFAISASFNYTHAVRQGSIMSFVLQLLLPLIIIGSLKVLRADAVNLVLGSLRSMLRIVARYAKNPLAQSSIDDDDYYNNRQNGTGRGRNTSDSGSYASSADGSDTDDYDGDNDEGDNNNIAGAYETEQLVTAVSKITDLLRKCWGVAGADIISTNLASRNGDFEVFNPTVPGKNVFALFAFAKICDFDHALKNLGGDVMILINDVADVVHGEVFRWGFGDSGQCNKNLGASFFMVFRIGSVKDTVEKLDEATRVVFSTAGGRKASIKKRSRRSRVSLAYSRVSSTDTNNSRSSSLGGISAKKLTTDLNAGKDVAMEAMESARQLSLLRIPGIQTFTDRAVIGMLKSFAGIHRDNQLRAWSRDFRLSAGVGTWSVDMIFGMDAGWAVEGAVGSEYKIDATYLSPHVNMAARMMSACKHYGVNILVSEAVQELMSEPAKNKMRNLDRVTVKGSSQVQNVYTYDTRSRGADFFLHNVTDAQAEDQARSYEPSIWDNDADLKAMRHHVTEDFDLEFMAGMKYYYDGDWPAAIEKFESANEIMVTAAMEEGYLHDEMDDSPDRKELYRHETYDRPSRYLINFMKSKGSKAPEDWDGWHPLLSK